MYDEILSSIDNIDDCVMEAEMNVIPAMINEYDKAIMIMENYNGDSYDCFDIFQEGFKDEVNKPIRGVKGENIIKRILMAIPRLIATLVRKIKSCFSKNEDQKLEENLDKIKKYKVNVKDLKSLKKFRFPNNNDSISTEYDINGAVNSTDNIFNEGYQDNQMTDLARIIHKKYDENINQETVRNAATLIESKTIKSTIDFEKVFSFMDEITKIYEEYNNIKYSSDKPIFWDKLKKQGRILEGGDKSILQNKITQSKPCEYSIDELKGFLKKIDTHLQQSIDFFNKQWKKSEEIRNKFININKQEERDNGYKNHVLPEESSIMDGYNTDLKFTRSITIQFGFILQIINEEKQKWSEATKIAVGILEEG